ETSTLNADAAPTADGQAHAEPVPAAAAPAPESPPTDRVASDEGESGETADTVAAVETANTDDPPQTEEIAESGVAAGADSAVAANDDPAIDPAVSSATDAIENAEALADTDADPVSQAEGSDAQPARKVALGEIGYDEQGRSGRIHVVVPGDTLWDISDAYLGTPWVWPSVWTDNRDIENPHLIVPSDRIWISAHEMRRVSAEEAERLLAGQPLAAEDKGEPVGPASDSFQSLFQNEDGLKIVRVSSLETTGLISADQLDASASIVDAVPEHIMLSQGDRVYIGLGEQEASVGDQFTVFRAQEKVFDPDTNRLLGYHVKLLGWVEVEETNAEASVALIRMSAAEMELGDRVMPRETPILDIEVVASPKNVDGQISFFPSSRVLMGSADYVYLNRGELDGLQVGSPLEVYRGGWQAPEPARDTRVEVPDRVIAQLLVVRARRQSAVAVIRHTETELELGDRFRGALE
ncbi:MAG: LysM peptidoglycan-binding domain-containing protein, partial [Myxococcota bacterium]